MLPRALAPGCGWARNAKNPSRVREVCARVEDDEGRPYLVVRGGHCGPARLLPIIVANESTEAVWHSPPGGSRRVSGCEQRRIEEFADVRERLLPARAAQTDRHVDGEAVEQRAQPGGEAVGVHRPELAA
jgi:hypothetical protein